jgi:uncharacterized membrane protein YfcA
VGHWRQRRIIPQVIRLIIPLGIIGAVLGVLSANALERAGLNTVLWATFGAVITYMLYDNVHRLCRRTEPAPLSMGDALDARHVNFVRALPVGLPTGFLGGLLGIGGGTFSVPSQQVFMRLPQKNAIANSAVVMIVFCGLAAVVKNCTVTLPDGLTHWHPLLLAALLAPSAMLGAFLGSRLTHRLPDRLVRILFSAFLAWTIHQCFFEKVRLHELVRDWLRS